jgi:hypothetical protein
MHHLLSKFLTKFAGLAQTGLLALVIAHGVFGQGITGSITGTVLDAGGAAVGGAVVTIRQAETELTRTVTTSDQGSYAVTQLAPGTYNITVVKPGFKTYQENDIVLAINQVAEVNAKLESVRRKRQSPLLPIVRYCKQGRLR